MKRLGSLLALCFLFACSCGAQTPKTTTPAEIVIHAGKVLDVRTGNYLTDQIIWIEGERIKAIGKAADISSQVPVVAKTIDLSNSTILPGLIDCHTHLTYTPYMAGPAGLHISYPRQALIGAHSARVALEAGFTTVRHVGASEMRILSHRNSIFPVTGWRMASMA